MPIIGATVRSVDITVVCCPSWLISRASIPTLPLSSRFGRAVEWKEKSPPESLSPALPKCMAGEGDPSLRRPPCQSATRLHPRVRVTPTTRVERGWLSCRFICEARPHPVDRNDPSPDRNIHERRREDKRRRSSGSGSGGSSSSSSRPRRRTTR